MDGLSQIQFVRERRVMAQLAWVRMISHYHAAKVVSYQSREFFCCKSLSMVSQHGG
jgi:hypothetical protein